MNNNLKSIKLVGWMTAVAVLCFAGFVFGFSGMIFSGASDAAVNAAQGEQPDSERTFLLRQKIWLMARVNLCEQEKEGTVPANRSVCPAEEQARVPEYKKRIIEIDRRLQGI